MNTQPCDIPAILRRLARHGLLLLVFATTWSVAVAQDQTWKINLKNAEIGEFITQISTITGKSFIVDPRVKGKVTVISNTALNADDTYELFLSVLRVHGFAAVPGENAIKIVQQVLAKQSSNGLDFSSDAGGEQLITRVVPVRNTESVELVKIMRPLIPQYGHIAGLARPNVLIISDHAENLQRLIKIVERVDVADDDQLELIPLEHAWVTDLVTLLETLAPEQLGRNAKGPNSVRIVANERTNTILLKGQPLVIETMRQLIDELDQPANRSDSIQVIRLAHSDAASMAELLGNLTGSNRQGNNSNNNNQTKTTIQADETLNALVIRAEPDVMAELRAIIEELDVRRVQVLIEAAIVEVTTSFQRNLGVELAAGDASDGTVPVAATFPSGTLVQLLQSLATGGTTLPALGNGPLLGAGRQNNNGASFAVLVQALATNENANLLSTPSIMTLDNEEAQIVVGQNVPFRTGQTITGATGVANPFTTIQRQDVGLTLQVTPQIHAGELVRLVVHQEVSEVDQTGISIGNAGASDLITRKRTIDTTILADDGEVVILGGLIRDKVDVNRSKVPLLGDVPVVGRLFRRDSRQQEKENLLVFLRPTILANREDAAEVSKRKYSHVRELVIEGTDPSNAMDALFEGVTPIQF